ncbi:MAG TPA: MOSC N-terminal beta barrel domain-containing protein [Mucilaginibacter sp.]|nr:MOSC N-terminal beta barrel domain-containing protein [Mucilaginibacter sp.]
MLKISELYIYPVKSLGGIRVDESRVTPMGLEYDRRWLLVDDNNDFVTQRQFPKMALLSVALRKSGITVSNKEYSESIDIPFNERGRSYERITVTIWDDTCSGELVSAEADNWFTKALGFRCRLVYMPDDTRRIVDQRYANENAITSFSDAYPFLLIGQASLDELNSRLTEPIPMNRFRPNIVFSGAEPFAEDQYGHFKIGGVDFYGVKLCARCVMTTVNQDTGVNGKEPLKTLAKYRAKDNNILFGQNLIHKGSGQISVGDELILQHLVDDERFIV